jgi:hypothetical protein
MLMAQFLPVVFRRPRWPDQPTTITLRVLSRSALTLRPLRRRHRELVERLLQVVQERLPFPGGDQEVPVRLVHRPAGVALRPARGRAQHLGDQVLEAGRGHAGVRLVDPRIGVEPGSVMTRSMKSATTVAML